MRVMTPNWSPVYHIQMVNNLCGYLGLLMWDSEIHSGSGGPANVGVTVSFVLGASNLANAGVDAPIWHYCITLLSRC